jgi:hypothetical protein
VWAADLVPATQYLQDAFPDVQFYAQGPQITRVWGAIFGLGQTPEHTADAFIREHSAVFDVAPQELQPGSAVSGEYTLPLMYQPETGTYKFTLVQYHQAKDGLPVYQADLRLLVGNEPDNPLVWAGSSLKSLGDFTVPAATLRSPAYDAVFGAALNAVPSLVNFTDSTLVIYAGVDEQKAAPTLAVTFVADNYGSPTATRPERYRFVADASTGEILYQEDLIVFTNVTGNVSGLATTIPKSDTCNPEVSTPMKYATVSIGSTTAYTDPNGNFTITNSGTSAVTVSSPMSGHYFFVSVLAGTLDALSQSVTPPGLANFVHNAANSDELVRSQINAYVQANVVRDWVLTYNPSYPSIATDVNFPLYVNSSNSTYCPGNAWYDGTALNFCRAGGIYPNTAYSSVVHHEYGHHAVESGGSGQDQYGEGMGDSFAVCLADDAILGYGFEGNCSAGIRTANNTMQYPCTSDIHTCAQLLSGCVWSTRNALVTTNPYTYKAILSNLVVNSILMHTGGSITPQIYADFTTLDGGPTGPHHAEIYAGFSAHNMVPALPPANDACANAIVVCPGTYTGTTSGATLDGSVSCDGSSPGPDVWYKYTPASAGSATFSLCTSSTTWDSVLSVHSGCPGTSTNQLNCSDDDCGGTGTHGTITRSVTAGTNYWIRIGGYSNVSGPFTLVITGPACQTVNYTLTTSVTGSGSIALNPPGGSYASGTSVQCTANAASGWHFDHWTGDLTGSTNPSTIVMNSNKSITAVFVQDQYTLTAFISPAGEGTVTLNPPGGTYLSGTTVQLTAAGIAGWHFDHWTGDLTGATNPSNILMNGNKSVTAVFVQDQYTLATSVSPAGKGSVMLSPPGGVYLSGTTVQLTAVAIGGWHFLQWTGDLTSSTSPTTIVMDGNKSVTALFVQDQYTLTTSVTGSGSIALNPPGGTYLSGTTVQVTANPAGGWHFDHWTDDLTGATNPSNIVMDGNKSVTAVFVQDQYTLTTNVTGLGSIALDPPGGTYLSGTSVQVTANAATGWHFDHWTDDLTGATNPSNIVMDGNKSVTAVFTQNPAGCLGDMNCDGRITFTDIDLFVEALSGESSWSHPNCPWINADVNGSGSVTFADIDPFVALIGTTCPP